MLPLEFTVLGPPVSQQTADPVRLAEWRAHVRQAASAAIVEGDAPCHDPVELVVVYYHDGKAVRIDNDNMVKPIQDALIGLVYRDDNQVLDSRIRRSAIDGAFRVRNLSPVLAQAFVVGSEFLHVQVRLAPDHAELI